MNRDQKIALLAAPFLLVGGWVATDLLLESSDEPTALYALEAAGECRPFDGACILQSGDMRVNVTDEAGVTRVNSSFPADRVALSLVYRDGREVVYVLDAQANPQFWQQSTAIREAMVGSGSAERLRIVVQVGGGQYLAEFTPAVPGR